MTARARPWGSRPARPDRVPERVDEPDAGPALLPDAGQVRGHQQLRARLEVRAVGEARGSHSPDRPDDLQRDRLGERVRVRATAAISSEWVIASTPVAAGRGRRHADGQRRVEQRPARQHRRMPDVVLAPGRLVGDDAVGVGLGAGARRSSGRR